MDEPEAMEGMMRECMSEIKLMMREVINMEKRRPSVLGESIDDHAFQRFLNRKAHGLELLERITAYAVTLNFDHDEKYWIKNDRHNIGTSSTGSTRGDSAGLNVQADPASATNATGLPLPFEPPGIDEDGEAAAAHYTASWLQQQQLEPDAESYIVFEEPAQENVAANQQVDRVHVNNAQQNAPAQATAPIDVPQTVAVLNDTNSATTPNENSHASSTSNVVYNYPDQDSLLAVGHYVMCKLSSVGGPLDFFVVPKELEQELAVVQDRLNQIDEEHGGSDRPIDRTKIVKDLPVMVRDPETRVLRRALVVVGGANNRDVYVRLVDIGNSMFLPAQEIQELPDELTAQFPFAYNCSIEKCDNGVGLVQEFRREFFAGQPVIVELKSDKLKNNRFVVDLKNKTGTSLVSEYKRGKNPVQERARRRVEA